MNPEKSGFVALFCFPVMPNLPVGAPSFGSYHFFPLAFEKIGAGKKFNTASPGNDSRAAFFALQKNGLWMVTLGGLKVLAASIDSWDAFVDATRGGWKPCLFRQESKRFKIERAQPGGIGTGNGVQTAFQLVKTRSYANGPANLSTEKVRLPHHNYPAMKVPVGNGEGTLLYGAGELVRVWVAGVEKFWGTHWQIDRESGLITFTAPPASGALVEAQCRFWVAMHGQDLYSLELSGGTYQLPSGATLRQMPGEAEILGEAS